MSNSQPTARRRSHAFTLAALVVAALVALLGSRLLAERSDARAGASGAAHPVPPRLQGGLAGVAAGEVPDGVTVFDSSYPGVTNLDPELLEALRLAATDAADDGIEFYVNSGWRTPAYQRRLLAEAVSTYGSRQEAARWVATADTSPHVSGEAVDIGPSAARTWLSERGSAYGLCQIFGNEPWHYELRPDAVGHGCPPVYADPTEDPRMQR